MRIPILAAIALATTALAVPAAEADSRSHGRSRDDRSYSRPSYRSGSAYGNRSGSAYGNRSGSAYGNRYGYSSRPYRSYGRGYRSSRPYYYSVRPYGYYGDYGAYDYGYYGAYDDGYYVAPPNYYYRRYYPRRPRIGFYFGF